MQQGGMGPLREEAGEGNDGGGAVTGVDIDGLQAEFDARFNEHAAASRRQSTDIRKTVEKLELGLAELIDRGESDDDSGDGEGAGSGDNSGSDPNANAEFSKMRRQLEKYERDMMTLNEKLSARDEKLERTNREKAITDAIELAAKDLQLITNGKRFAFNDIAGRVTREEPENPESRLLYQADEGSVPLIDGVKSWFDEVGPDITKASGNSGTGARGSGADAGALLTDVMNLPKEERAARLKELGQHL